MTDAIPRRKSGAGAASDAGRAGEADRFAPRALPLLAGTALFWLAVLANGSAAIGEGALAAASLVCPAVALAHALRGRWRRGEAGLPQADLEIADVLPFPRRVERPRRRAA